MNNRKRILHFTLFFFIAASVVSCTKNGTGAGDQNSGNLKGSFFIATTTEGNGSVILNTDNLESGSITTVGQGIGLSQSYTSWTFNQAYKVAFGLYYAQGDPGQGISYKLTDNLTLTKAGADVQIPDRFTSYGMFENYLITSVGGFVDSLTNPGQKDTLSIFNFFDVANGNAITRKPIKSTNFGGGTQMATFSGIVDMGNGEFLTGAVLSGAGNAGSGGSSSSSILYPDNCWVAAFDKNMNLKRVYRDNRISYASGRYRSQYYSQIAADDNKNCYVFSGAYEATTTRKAGAIRINNGATSFDQNYYFDLQTPAGGFKFRKVWHVTGDYFLLEYYNATGTITTTTGATQYALVNMTTKTFQWLSEKGFPAMDSITSIGLLAVHNGKVYIPVNTANEKPTVYVLNPATGTLTKGLVVDAASITALGRLSN